MQCKAAFVVVAIETAHEIHPLPLLRKAKRHDTAFEFLARCIAIFDG